jgi:hypothetical protein
MNAADRDRMIIDLRKRGKSYRAIGKAVGLTESGVRYALIRISEGRGGRAPR